MEKNLEKFTTTALRRLFIEETKVFIMRLEQGSASDLSENRLYLKHIFDLLIERESKEKAILQWGKNSANFKRDESQSSSMEKDK